MRRLTIILFLMLFILAGESSGNSQQTITAEDLAEIRDIGGHAYGAISVSPDGRWVAFQIQSPEIVEGDYELTWMVLSLDSNRVRKIANGGDVILNPTLTYITNGNRPPERAKWSPNSKSFAYLLRRNGETQIWRSQPGRQDQSQLTENAGDIIDFAWSNDGSKLFYIAGLDRTKMTMLEKEEGARGFLYDDRYFPRISKRPVLRDCGGPDYLRAKVSLARACEPAVWIYDLSEKAERLATSEEAQVYAQLRSGEVAPKEISDRTIINLVRSDQADRFAWLENTDPDIFQGPYAPLTIFARIDGNIKRCSSPLCKTYRGPEGMWWRENGEELVFLRRVGHNNSETGVYAWSPSTNYLRTITRSDDLLADCSLAGDQLICLHEASMQPREIVSVSLEDGSIRSLFDPNPELHNRHYPKIEKLEWMDAFGNETHGHLVYPLDYVPGRTYPLVIVTYRSRGFLRGGIGDEFPIYPLSAEGMFVLSHDVPFDLDLIAKDPDYQAKLNHDQYRRKMALSSQEIVIRRLVDAKLIESSKIAITGLSDGAAQVSYALTHSNISFAAAIAQYVGSLSSSFYYLENEYLRAYWRNSSFNGFRPDDPESGLNEISIGLNAEQIESAFLINTSDEEFLASVENVARLKDADKIVEMYVFPDEHHIKWRPDHRLAVYRRNIQWLKFWLKGEQEDDPVSPGQYERWREMRDKRCTWDEPQNKKPSYCDYSSMKH